RRGVEVGVRGEGWLVELLGVAEGGIPPLEEMAFYVPWADHLSLDAFLEFHRDCWEAWRPEQWSLNLIAFLEGMPIGSQGMGAADFAARREVQTGSWLGAPYQGKGLGTEQRAGVLELAFSGLRAQAAVRGA